MKLATWLEKSGMSDAQFADRIGVSRQALWRYKAGDRIPRAPILGAIQDATLGAVRPSDFFDAPSKEQAA